ncbi:hypothetical protein IWQ47_004466 [Aquimarina sp. EL_43]|uniref:hypothetical protein n=1 Tax=unclassified Aquimarina TaxID=2627091 RepID=UPI0018CA7C79|nr:MULTISPECIES: hypothetical protein [unclassified Aquimarina]MBG6133200.1 hypothetical protein [Aquimarina sp. EL_35]MBG6153358.1 hypothetical protein [Aquimarina sp. EL_32]MBG6171373.1 hypothetical protein [Aquimarina sp. EL_43]
MEVKEIWTNEDFREMGWHDSRLYQIKFPDEECNFTLYLDYIFKWEKQENDFFKFWVSPCEMIFKNVLDSEINISFKKAIGIDIIEIKREKVGLTPNGKMIDWKFLIETDKGTIELIATDFEMNVISQPVLSDSQSINN